MPCANRCFVAGAVWHITQRCHKREFLLRHRWCRRRWIYWLFEARKRFGLCVLNYTVTSNHVHLLVKDFDQFPQGRQFVRPVVRKQTFENTDARKLSDPAFQNVVEFTRAAFELAMRFAKESGDEPSEK